MKNIFYMALSIFLGLAVASCDRENITYNLGIGSTSGKTGTLDLSSFDAVPNDDIIKSGKSPISRAVDTGDFTVQIYQATEATETLEWKYSEVPEIVTLNVGDYKLAVFSHDVQPAEWEKPYYYADKTFSIEENRVTHIDTLVCTLQNIKVTVSFTEDLKTLMGNDCNVSVVIGSGTLEYAKDEARAGYFRSDSESNLLIATFTGTIDGNEEVSRIQVDNVKAGDWRKITYDIKRPEPGSESGGVTPSVSLDVSCETIDHEGNVTIDEEVIEDPNPIEPGTDPDDPDDSDDPDDPTPAEGPKITSETVALGTPVVVTDGMQVKVLVTSSDPNGITALTVDIQSPTLTPDELSGIGLSDHLDLAYPGEMKAALESLGFPTGENVLNHASASFDISGFLSLLKILGPATHTFVITATDAQGTTVESLILVTE